MKIHMVKKGDTLSAIAQKYNIDLDALVAANPQIADPNVIEVGMKVKIPNSPKSVTPPTDYHYKHVVAQGDTLWKLGKTWNVSLQEMIEANPQLKNPSVLMTGEIVYIPKMKPHAHVHHQKTPAYPYPMPMAAQQPMAPMAPMQHMGTYPGYAQPGGGFPQAGMIPEAPQPQAAMPGAQIPEAQMPQAQMPQKQMPQAQMPQAQMPGHQMPEAPHAQIPGYQMHEVPYTQMPFYQMPEQYDQMMGYQMHEFPYSQMQVAQMTEAPHTGMPAWYGQHGMAAPYPEHAADMPETGTDMPDLQQPYTDLFQQYQTPAMEVNAYDYETWQKQQVPVQPEMPEMVEMNEMPQMYEMPKMPEMPQMPDMYQMPADEQAPYHYFTTTQPQYPSYPQHPMYKTCGCGGSVYPAYEQWQPHSYPVHTHFHAAEAHHYPAAYQQPAYMNYPGSVYPAQRYAGYPPYPGYPPFELTIPGLQQDTGKGDRQENHDTGTISADLTGEKAEIANKTEKLKTKSAKSKMSPAHAAIRKLSFARRNRSKASSGRSKSYQSPWINV